jgi:hypothetical protein
MVAVYCTPVDWYLGQILTIYCTQFEWYHEQIFTVNSTICAVCYISFIVTYVTQLLNGNCSCSVHFQHLVNYHIYLTVRSEFFPDFLCEKWWAPCNPAQSAVCSVYVLSWKLEMWVLWWWGGGDTILVQVCVLYCHQHLLLALCKVCYKSKSDFVKKMLLLKFLYFNIIPFKL